MIGAAIAAGAVVYTRWCEPRFRRWGATDAETTRWLPVDDLVRPVVRATTRAVSVAAPRERVWPWLVQMGQERAGFYSYSWLENLVGAGMHNASAIHPEWQQRARGDVVRLASESRYHDLGRQVVALVEPPYALVLVSPEDWDRIERGERALGAWGFFLEPDGDGRTRFLVRTSGGLVGTHWFDAVHFLMEQRMMRSVRDRADAARLSIA
jgi:hypothetical protein